MQLVIGGAFSGKRKIVKEISEKNSWISAYEGDILLDWETKWEIDSTLVLEGFEKWIASELQSRKKSDEIRSDYKAFFQSLLEAEQKMDNNIVLIMLEVGRGIVPLQKDDRELRDLAGWIAQDASHIADEVNFVWNGFSKRLK